MSGPIIPIWIAIFVLVIYMIPMVIALVAVVAGVIVRNWIWTVTGLVGGWFYWLIVLRRVFN